MKRVVVTGLGIVSSIGNNRNEVVDSLKEGRSGIAFRGKFTGKWGSAATFTGLSI